VSGRIQLWKDGGKEQLITECREETQAYIKVQLTRQPKKRTAEQAEDERVRQALELSHRGKQGKAARKVAVKTYEATSVGGWSENLTKKQVALGLPAGTTAFGCRRIWPWRSTRTSS
jgi:hypothetical protein